MMYDRLIKLIGMSNYDKLSSKTVAVIGLGGVGSSCTEALVRGGIGNVVIVDFDIIDISNLNRQILTTKENIGNKKTDEEEMRIKSISNCNVVKLNIFLDENNIDELFSISFDYLIDACDSINTKKCIIRECLKRSIPFISCMGTGNKLDPLKFKICDIRDTSYDPIAKIIRKYVKDSNIKEKVMVLCSDEPTKKVSGNISSISYMPVVAGNICASYIIRKILEDF